MVRLPATGLGALEPVGRLLQKLVDAGFAVDEAEPHPSPLSHSREYPYVSGVTAALSTVADDAFPVLRQFVPTETPIGC
jgi:hypothetical protein